jgi:hypothetical protein
MNGGMGAGNARPHENIQNLEIKKKRRLGPSLFFIQ